MKGLGKRVNLVEGRRIQKPWEVVCTDFSELVYANGRRKAHLMVIVDHVSKCAMGGVVEEKADSELALKAWRKALREVKGFGGSLRGSIVHHDQDPVYTGGEWLREVVLRRGAKVSYSLKGAKGNVYMESFFGRFKEENKSMFAEARDLEGLKKVVERRIRYYNRRRRHSAIGNVSPIQFLKEKGVGRPVRHYSWVQVVL